MATIYSIRRAVVSYQLLVRHITTVRNNNAAVSIQSVLKETPSTDIDHEWENAKPYEEMPGLRSLPGIGTGWIFLPFVGAGIPISKEFELMKRHYKNFGPIWKDSFPVFPQMVSTVKPEDAEKVFRADGKFPNRPGLEGLDMYRKKRVEHFTLGGVLVDNGEEWWKIRSMSQQPFLKNKNVFHYAPVLGQIADEFIDRMRLIRSENKEMPHDFLNEMYRWALESVAVVGLNTRLGCLDANMSPDSEAQKMIDATNYSFDAFYEMQFSLRLWKYFKTPTLRKLFKAQDVITDTSVKYISKTMEAIKKKNPDSDDDSSILEQLLIRGMTLPEAAVMMIDMLMAGIDTTSNSTAFLLYFLAKNPDKQKKLREEIHAVVGKKGNAITPSHLNELSYLKACVKETLRLRPATAGNFRVINEDLVLSGYRVPKGTAVRLLHQFTCHLEEYFPDSQKFIPERWMKGGPEESHHHSYAILPFGFGTRMCIGRRLAELEMWQLTAKMMQNFEIQYHHQDIGWITRAVNTPDQPLRFKLIDLE